MKKKAIIISSIVLGVIALVLTLMFTLFTVRYVDFNSLNQNNYDTTKINVDKGGVVFFLNKKSMITEIEKEHPYINVINIETVFPNKLIVHYAQREETFAIKDFKNDVVYIVDDEMIVLRILNTENYVSTQYNAILVENLAVKNSSVNLGDVLSVDYNLQIVDDQKDYFQSLLTNISDNFLLCSRDVAEQCATIKNITFFYDEMHQVIDEDGFVMQFTTFDDFEIKIYKPNYRLAEKIQIVLTALPSCVPDYLNSSYLEVLENAQGEIFCKISLKA